MALTPEQLEQLKRELVSWAFQVEQPQTVEGADQIIRTQVHPQLYESAHHLNGLLLDGGTGTVRRVAEHMGHTGVTNVFPHVQHVVDDFRHERGDHAMLGHTMRELLVLASLFHESTLNQLFGALYAMQARNRLQRRYDELVGKDRHAVPLQVFARDFEELQQESQRQLVRDITPRATVPVPPVTVNVRDGDELVTYNVPARVRVFDPIARHHDVVLEQPEEREYFSVEHRVSIPWENITDGVILQVAVRDQFGGVHPPHNEFVERSELETIRARGSAVPANIGRGGHIRLYPEYFVSLDGVSSDLPEEPLASIRARGTSVDVTKHTNHCQLTIAV